MQYKVTDYALDSNGYVTNENSFDIIIDTNYKLWNAFGGEYSCSLDKKGNYILDESSIEAVVEIMNTTGYIINPNGEIRY